MLFRSRLAALRPITEIFKLHDVERSSVDADIRLFYNTHLANVAERRSLGEGWPSLSDINILGQKTAGLFIYASTVVKFVSHERYRPTKRLSLLVSLPQNTGYEGGGWY